ncbi:hypothetical protein [Chelativorans sp. Marseille-P2723]|nr:hypothetical protein [Chelativorans sp. Marseille-P2723]
MSYCRIFDTPSSFCGIGWYQWGCTTRFLLPMASADPWKNAFDDQA